MTIIRYFGCRLIQRIDKKTTPFFIFHSRAKDLKQWAGIRRTQEVEKGSQRVLRPSRSRAVTSFLEVASINTIPNNILISFQPGQAKFISLDYEFTTCMSSLKKFEDDEQTKVDFHNQCEEQLDWGFLEFSFKKNQPEELRPALIVDGQHRLDGMYNFKTENIPVLVVSLIDATPQEQAFQFIVINKKAVRVSTDNVKSIIADFDEKELENRLSQVNIEYGNAPSILKYLNDSPLSPFQNLLQWSYNRDVEGDNQLVPITAIEQALRYIRKEFAFLAEDDDSVLDFFCTIWGTIKKHYPELWGKDNKFMKKVNINALNEYIVYRLKVFWSSDMVDVFDMKQVEDKIFNIVKRLRKEFWMTEWTVQVQDNANVREMIKNDLQTMIDNDKLDKNWNEDLELPIIEN